MKHLELGLSLPIAKNGFVYSASAPPYVPSFNDCLRFTRMAEDMGLDFVFSMSKWRGFGGKTQFWDSSLESFTLMASLAALTKRVTLFGTVCPLLFHPAMIAKMAATLDDVTGHRFGLNIITGAALEEFTQMGVVPEGYDHDRYAYAAEWLEVVKKLWSEPSVTHRGRFFTLQDCISFPKPARPVPLICAASSDEGLRFTVQNVDYSFVSGRDISAVAAKSLHVRKMAAEERRPIKVATPLTLVMADSQAEAADLSERLIKAADVEALVNAGAAYGRQGREAAQIRALERSTQHRQIYFGLPIVGGPREIADAIVSLALDGNIDCALLNFHDYDDGLRRFEASVMPLLRGALHLGSGPQ